MLTHKQLIGWVFSMLLLTSMMSFTVITDIDTVMHQHTEFWLVWLITMVLVVYPLTLLELALFKRKSGWPLVRVDDLTREADAPKVFRGAVWLGVFSVGALAFAAVALAYQTIAHGLIAWYPAWEHVPYYVGYIVCVLAAFACSLQPKWSMVLGAIAASIVLVGAFILHPAQHWQWHALSWSTIAAAIKLALLGNVLGLGVYWALAHIFTPNVQVFAVKQQAAYIMLLQVLIGVSIACIAQQHIVHSGLAVVLGVAMLLFAAVLLYVVIQNMMSRRIAWAVQLLVSGLGAALFFLPQTTVLALQLLPLFMASAALGLTVFVAYRMKLSHLRKALQFDQELNYNLWRVLVRFLVPLACLIVIVHALMQWF